MRSGAPQVSFLFGLFFLLFQDRLVNGFVAADEERTAESSLLFEDANVGLVLDLPQDVDTVVVLLKRQDRVAGIAPSAPKINARKRRPLPRIVNEHVPDCLVVGHGRRIQRVQLTRDLLVVVGDTG